MFYLLNITINFNAKKKMKKGFSKFIPLLLSFVDILLLIGSFLLANYLVFSGQIPNFIFYNSLIIGWSILWVVICLKFDLYELPRIFFTHKIVSKNLYGLITFCFLSGGFIFFITDYKFSRLFFVFVVLFFSFLVLLWRIFSIYILKKYRRKGYNSNRVLLVGLNKNISTLIEEIYLNRNYGFQIAGLFTDAIRT